MKIVVVSSRWPFGNKEPYLRTELGELTRHFDRIAVVPVRTPRGKRQVVPEFVDVLAWPVLSAEVVRRALQMFWTRPQRVVHTLMALARSRDPGHVKNALVALKGLALAHWSLENQIGHIHAYWLSAPATVAMIAGEVASIPWSATAHRWDIYERNALDLKARSAAFVRTISERGTRDLRERSPALGERIVQMPLGAVVPQPPSRRVAVSRAFHIVCPAALVAVKGHEELLDAVWQLRERGVPVLCTIAGEGPLRGALALRIEDRALGAAVRLSGFIPQERLHGWYRHGRVNAVVLASLEDARAMEGIPSALVEAMAYGVPVVATSSGSVGELVDDRCGHIVPPGDSNALADALFDVYRHPFEAFSRAANAYARVAAAHDVRRQMNALSERIHS